MLNIVAPHPHDLDSFSLVYFHSLFLLFSQFSMPPFNVTCVLLPFRSSPSLLLLSTKMALRHFLLFLIIIILPPSVIRQQVASSYGTYYLEPPSYEYIVAPQKREISRA
eukprot:GHVT01002788.1.p1 GENE.GHVT01002788.1~~GHVT01002788.1.p1  ORF type:complete len:109 (+),score=6.49 GHVT01002788.1:36-362(+)